MKIYLLQDGTGPDRDIAFASEKGAYEWWIEYVAGGIEEYLDKVDQADKDQLLKVWNDTTIDIVKKVRTIDKILKGCYLHQDCMSLISMDLYE